MFRQIASAILALTILACGGKGAGTSTVSPAAPLAVSIAPNSADLVPGESLAVTAAVSSADSTTLTWSVDNVPNGNDTVGSVQGSGSTVTYTAPATEGSHLLVASNKTSSGSAQLRVQSILITVGLTPSTVTLNAGGSQSFTATISGTTNTAAIWTVDGITNGNATVGTVTGGSSTTITYNAPATAGTHTLTVLSQANHDRGDSSTITVRAAVTPPVISVLLSPTSATLTTGTTQSFTVTVSGSSNTAVTWLVDGITGGNATVGTVAGSGASATYTAPAAAGSHTLAARSQADATQSASSNLTVQSVVAPPVVSVLLSPASATITAGGVQSFTAAVSGSTNTAVTWTVDGIAGGNGAIGTVNGTGATVSYTAPASAGTHVLKAASQADATKSSASTLTIQALPPVVSVALNPSAASLSTGATQSFTAAVTGSSNLAISWDVDGYASGNASVGTITGTGTTVSYTAPSLAGSHSVTATSQADTGKRASSAVTVSANCAPAPTSPAVVNVKDAAYGAKGDGVTDDTAALQRAVNAVATGGTVSLPDGTYMVNALTSVLLKSNMTLSLSQGAVLKAIANSATGYAIVTLSGVNHVNVVGGTLLGERSAHSGTTGEWGMGLKVVNSQQVFVERVLAQDCWGDGFYVGTSSNITLCNVVADHNRRQGLTITSVDSMVVRNCTFKNTTGTLPEDGIDIEPNVGDTAKNILITGCTITGNSGFGIEIGVPGNNTGKAWITGVVVDGNTCTGNGVNTLSTSPRAGIQVNNTPGHQITNNICSSNGLGILLRNGANGCTVTGNTANQNFGEDGIQVYSTAGNVITGNTAKNNARYGIYSVDNTTITISNNTMSGNGVAP